MGSVEMLKHCQKCNGDKPLFDFTSDSRTSDGLRKTCIPCTEPSNRANSVCGICGHNKELGKDCRPCARRRNAEYKSRHAAKLKVTRSEYKKALWIAGAVQRKAKREAKAATAKLRMAEAKKAWKERNKHKVIENTARRFAAKMNATPKWRDQLAIDQVYMLARFMSESTGVKWHVDHVVPLRGKNVCGLHVEHNLTFLPAAFNIAKSNKFEDWADITCERPLSSKGTPDGVGVVGHLRRDVKLVTDYQTS